MTIQATLFSFVNRWECDENDHLNVQFYFSRFEEADRQFRLMTGLSETVVGLAGCATCATTRRCARET